MIRKISALGVVLMACETTPQFNYLIRPGQGTTGSAEETAAYYGAMRDRPPEQTLTEWMRSRHFFKPGTQEYRTEVLSAYYYNGSDLGLGREMRCVDGSSVPEQSKLIACVVSNHGVPQGLDRIAFGRGKDASITKALTDLEKYLQKAQDRHDLKSGVFRGASVAMDFHPDRADRVRFYVYDATDPALLHPDNAALDDKPPERLIPGLQLDGESGVFNQGIKYIRNCLACHGGRYDATTHQIRGATFLDFDVSLFTFSDDPVAGAGGLAKLATKNSANLDSLRRLNALVLKVATATGHTQIQARINGSYSGPSVQDPNSKYVGGYVPPGWPDDLEHKVPLSVAVSARITPKQFFTTVVHQYCSTCHFSQASVENLEQIDAARPLTFADVGQWFENTNLKAGSDSQQVIRNDVCSSLAMPHAEVTRLNLLADKRAFSLICN